MKNDRTTTTSTTTTIRGASEGSPATGNTWSGGSDRSAGSTTPFDHRGGAIWGRTRHPCGVSEPADLAWGVFSDHAPWVLEDRPQAWQAHLHLVREATRRSAPELARPRKVPPLGRLLTVTRHLGVGVGRWALTD